MSTETNFKTGDILFTSRKPKLSKPRTWVSGVINFLQTKKLRNLNQTPTHTGTIIFINGFPMVIDSDVDGVDVEHFEKWAQNRSFIKVFRPNEINDLTSSILYTELALSKAGNEYGWKSIDNFVVYLCGKKYLGRLTTLTDNMICSVFTAYLYNLKDWQIQTPQSLWVNRFKNFPKGEDISEFPINSKIRTN